jgi:hypothetical protein
MAGASTCDWHGVHWEEGATMGMERVARDGAGVSCGGANEWGTFVF